MDRKNGMIISGGVNIYPAEIEVALATMPGLRDAAVFGVSHAEYGESVMAAVELLEGADVCAGDVQSYLRERIAGYKVPRTVDVHTHLPRDDSGKILKRELRDPNWEAVGRRI